MTAKKIIDKIKTVGTNLFIGILFGFALYATIWRVDG